MKMNRRTLVGTAASGVAAAGLHSVSGIPTAGASQIAGTPVVPGSSATPWVPPAEGEFILGKDATAATRAANASVLTALDFDNVRQIADIDSFADATRGFIATFSELTVADEDGREIWDLTQYAFLDKEDAPATVNPSLWRQARLNMTNGLFEVVEGVYQVRGFDLSNMTIIEGENGIIIIDPLVSAEVASAALELYYEHRPVVPVVAVMYTHSHVDHFGGVLGVVDPEDVRSGAVQVIAPQGFLEEAVSENVTVGAAMSRRSDYQLAPLLPRGERGQVDSGIGKTKSTGTITLVPPTDVIVQTGETRTIAGVEMEFLMTPNSEAPAEFMIYFPGFRVFNSAELACDTVHNLYTLRGAKVRDAVKWSSYLNEAIARYGERTDVVISQHNWPKWGQEAVVAFLAAQRDMYKFIHDQTVRMMNRGYTATEIAEIVEPPEALAQQWFLRGYYGTISHNVKAVYQQYLGWYDANPANLEPHPPEEAARRYVAYMGGADAVIALARQDFERGEYRWVAEVMNRVVFADPDNREARHLQADALEQLGYQAESAVWRNVYLTGAFELRNGILGKANAESSSGMIRSMTMPMIFDYLGVHLDAAEAEGKHIVLNWTLTDPDEKYVLNLEHAALTFTPCPPGVQSEDADASITLSRATLDAVLAGELTIQAAFTGGTASVEGNAMRIAELFGLIDTFSEPFNIVTP